MGGSISEAVHELLNPHAGFISGHNEAEPVGLIDLSQLLFLQVRMEGFIITDYLSRQSEAYAPLTWLLPESWLHWRADVVEGMENALSTLVRLFSGGNTAHGTSTSLPTVEPDSSARCASATRSSGKRVTGGAMMRPSSTQASSRPMLSASTSRFSKR